MEETATRSRTDPRAIYIDPALTEEVTARWNSSNRRQLKHRTVHSAVISVKYGLPPEGVAKSLRVKDTTLSELLSIYEEVTGGTSSKESSSGN